VQRFSRRSEIDGIITILDLQDLIHSDTEDNVNIVVAVTVAGSKATSSTTIIIFS
jgi:hypothetical protein